MNKLCILVASAVFATSVAVAEPLVDSESIAVTRQVPTGNWDELQTAWGFTGQRPCRITATSISDEDVFATAAAKEFHADWVWALDKVERSLSALAWISPEANLIASTAAALKIAANSKYEEAFQNVATQATVIGVSYAAQRAANIDIAENVTKATAYGLGAEELKNPALKKAAKKFSSRFGKIISEKAARAGRLVLRWVIGKDQVDDSTALGRAYIKTRSAVKSTTETVTQKTKGWMRKAVSWGADKYVKAKRFFGFGQEKISSEKKALGV